MNIRVNHEKFPIQVQELEYEIQGSCKRKKIEKQKQQGYPALTENVTTESTYYYIVSEKEGIKSFSVGVRSCCCCCFCFCCRYR